MSGAENIRPGLIPFDKFLVAWPKIFGLFWVGPKNFRPDSHLCLILFLQKLLRRLRLQVDVVQRVGVELQRVLGAVEARAVQLVGDGLVAVRVAEHNGQDELVVRQLHGGVASARRDGKLALQALESSVFNKFYRSIQ